METAYLETLIVVSELGSFSAAARRLHVTQSALSRRVAALEQQLGVELLDRSGPTVTCTEAGLCVLESARKILSIERQLPKRIAELGCASGLAMGCTRGFGATWLQGLLAQVEGHCKTRRIVVTMEATQDLISGFRRGNYDIVFMEHCHLEALSDLLCTDLGEDEVVFVSAGTGIQRDVVTVEELQGHSLYVCPSRCCTRQLLERNLARTGRGVDSFRRVIEPGDTHLLKRTMLESGGVTFGSRRLFAEELRAGRMRAHTVDGFEHHRRVVLLAQSEALLEVWAGYYRGLSGGCGAVASPAPADGPPQLG